MAKEKLVFFCKECGNEQSKWFGKCPACGVWNSCTEEPTKSSPLHSGSTKRTGLVAPTTPRLLSSIEKSTEERIDMYDGELNRVLGGGLVIGSMVLLGGEPGIGKSTLVLQTVMRLKGRKVLYISGEESLAQLKMRADRIGTTESECYLLCETSLERSIAQIQQLEPDLVILDSIQTLVSENSESTIGSVSQIRECAAALLRIAKENDLPMIVIGHINKEGTIAGPKVLEHIVDVVLQFEGDKQNLFRVVRASKNRYGSASELGIYEMGSDGLREVTNPSERLISESHQGLSGVAIGVTIEGIRPFLIEVQSLVSSSVYSTSQRSTTGFDQRRMNMLLAVIEKRAGFKLIQKDIFLNIAGGIRVNDPALDLAVVVAVISSGINVPVGPGWCLAGEVGLSGEIRPVSRIEQRIAEAQKLGFTSILIPEDNLKAASTLRTSIVVRPVRKIEEVFHLVFQQPIPKPE